MSKRLQSMQEIEADRKKRYAEKKDEKWNPSFTENPGQWMTDKFASLGEDSDSDVGKVKAADVYDPRFNDKTGEMDKAAESTYIGQLTNSFTDIAREESGQKNKATDKDLKALKEHLDGDAKAFKEARKASELMYNDKIARADKMQFASDLAVSLGKMVMAYNAAKKGVDLSGVKVPQANLDKYYERAKEAYTRNVNSLEDDYKDTKTNAEREAKSNYLTDVDSAETIAGGKEKDLQSDLMEGKRKARIDTKRLSVLQNANKALTSLKSKGADKDINSRDFNKTLDSVKVQLANSGISAGRIEELKEEAAEMNSGWSAIGGKDDSDFFIELLEKEYTNIGFNPNELEKETQRISSGEASSGPKTEVKMKRSKKDNKLYKVTYVDGKATSSEEVK